jgi:ABC-2 type transport system ATP-binding protein
VRLLGQAGPDSLHLEVTGAMDGLVRALAAYPLQDLETERPSLEEIFLAYYRDGAPAGK